MKGIGVSRRFGWAFTGLAAVLALIFYREFILDGSLMLYGDDMVNEGFQLRSFGVDEIHSGRGFPFWNPFVYGGQPYLAILPGPVFYPTSLLYLVMPLTRAIGWTFVLHTFLSAVFAYLAGRSIGMDRVPAAVSGLAFMSTGFRDRRSITSTLTPSLSASPLAATMERCTTAPYVNTVRSVPSCTTLALPNGMENSGPG